MAHKLKGTHVLCFVIAERALKRVARWLDPNVKIVGVWPVGPEGLWLRYTTLQNLIPYIPLVALDWREGEGQILPYGHPVPQRVKLA